MSLEESANQLQELGWLCLDGPLNGKFILSSDYIVTPGFSFQYGTNDEPSVYTMSSDGLFVLREDSKGLKR